MPGPILRKITATWTTPSSEEIWTKLGSLKYEAQVVALSAQLSSSSDEELVPLGPHERWIEAHADELRKYPDEWVLLDPEQGIVFHTADQAEFGRYLERFGPEDRARLMPFHTSMYV